MWASVKNWFAEAMTLKQLSWKLNELGGFVLGYQEVCRSVESFLLAFLDVKLNISG